MWERLQGEQTLIFWNFTSRFVNKGGDEVEVDPIGSYQIFFQKQLGKCNKCRRIVDGKVLRVSDDAVYHKECFTCTVSDTHANDFK